MHGKRVLRTALLALITLAAATAAPPDTNPAGTQPAGQPGEARKEATPAATPEAAPEDLEATVRELVRKLDSPSPQQREKATLGLLELGEPAGPILRPILDQEKDRLSDEQRTQIESILRDGDTLLMEKRSGLSDEDMGLLRTLGKRVAGRMDDSQRPEQQFEQIINNPSITDSGLALVVQTVLKRAPKSQQDERNDSGRFDCRTVTRLLAKVAGHDASGKLTGSALNEWVRRFYLAAALTESESWRLGGPTEARSLIQQILLRDWLDADCFQQILDDFCKRAADPKRMPGYEFTQQGSAIFISACGSRHARGDHIPQLLQVLIQRDAAQADDYCIVSQMQAFLIGSERFTEAHARASIAWYLRPDPPRNWCGHHTDELFWRLTGADIWTGPPTDTPDAATRPNSPKAAAARWIAWWDKNSDKPVGSLKQRRTLRCIAADLELSGGDKPRLTIAADLQVQENRGYLIRPAGNRLVWWFQLTPPKAIDVAGHETQAWLRKCCYVDEWKWSDSGGTYGLARGPLLLGEVRTKRRDKRRPDSDETAYELLLVLDPAEAGPQPTSQQLTDLAFWEQLVIDAGLRAARAATSKTALGQCPPASIIRPTDLSELDGLRTPGLKKALDRLQSDPLPRVAASAGLQLARWKEPIDQKRMEALLAAGDSEVAVQAATALGLAGHAKGVQGLIKLTQAQGPSGPAYAALKSLADAGAFDETRRAELAREVIRTLLSEHESPLRPAIRQAVLARAWSGQDFGYRPGGDPQENAGALAKFHEWAGSARPQETRPAIR